MRESVKNPKRAEDQENIAIKTETANITEFTRNG